LQFDYFFLSGIALDWLILALVIFARKFILPSSFSGKKKRFFLWIYRVFFILLILAFLVKIAFAATLAFPAHHKILSAHQALFLLLYLIWQILSATLILFFGGLLLLKDGFETGYESIWLEKTFFAMILFLLLDLFLSTVGYFLLLRSLLEHEMQSGSLRTLAVSGQSSSNWMILGLILSAIVYFIFYASLKRKIKKQVVAGFSVAYLLVLGFSIASLWAYRSAISPQLKYLWNHYLLSWAFLGWGIILFTGIFCLILMEILVSKRGKFKNALFYQYLFLRLGNLQALSVFGMILTTFVPVIFFLYY
jgi:hypothetical protein